MENSNRPVQRVIPIRSELQNRSESIINCESSTNNNESRNQYKSININQSSIIDSVPFVQQNVNIMNINLPNNTILQGVSHDPSNNFSQTSSSPKTYLQLSDGRYVQIAQNIQPTQQQMPTTILVQMPYKLVDQPVQNFNPALVNKRFLLPSKANEKSPQNNRFITVGNTSNLVASNQSTELYSKVDAQIKQMEQLPPNMNDYQKNMIAQLREVKDQMNNNNGSGAQNVATSNGNIISIEKYQEISDLLQTKKLLLKSPCNEEMVLVEFRLNQQKYQLRMTRHQKVDMEKLLISAGNQQRQMEILQVYQSEQRKSMQQRTSVVLNQIINKNQTNIICNSPQIQTLNLTKPIYPLNSMLVAVSQNQYNDVNLVQSSHSINQQKNVSIQSTASANNPNGVIFTTRTPQLQSSILSIPSIPRDNNKDITKPKRIVKNPISYPPTIPNIGSNQDMKPARARRYNNMRKVLSEDQSAVITPSYCRPFDDLHDVARRLLPYHILEECKEQSFDEVDKLLKNTFNQLNKRCTNLKRIASSITMKDMLMEKNEEQLLIKRMQLDLERDVFERDKICQGDVSSVKFENTIPFDNTVIVIEDTPPPTVECDQINIDDDDDNTFPSTADNSMTFVESIDSATANVDITQPVFDNENNVLDSLYNYDIQDISNDDEDESPSSEGLDWKYEEMSNPSFIAHTLTSSTSLLPLDDQQSQDPDLDAAIKSILF